MTYSACPIINRVFDKALSNHPVWYNAVKDFSVVIMCLNTNIFLLFFLDLISFNFSFLFFYF